MAKPVVLTGLRANSEFHLGNYLGGILPMVQLQKKFAGEYQLNMFVPDLHSFTTPVEHSELYLQIINNLKVYVAAGLDLDSEDTFIYRQSFVAAHSELAVILNNFAYFGELQRMTQFKEKSAEAKDGNVTVGLFDYPVLMAADI
jgi:tryptophanyl-tRNA synthetase